MIALLRRLFTPRPQRHYLASNAPYASAVCACGHNSVWDYDLRKHFEEVGRVGA